MINDFNGDDKTRRRFNRREPLPKDVYDFDGNGPILTDVDDELLDRIWAKVAEARRRQTDDEE